MKVLVVCVPGAGHVQPLLPLVRAMLAAGDEVVVATGEDPGGSVARCGARFVSAGHGEFDWFTTLRQRVRGMPGDGLRPERIAHYFLPRLFGEVAAADMVDDVLAVGRELRPDVVVYDTYALAAPLVADILGVPAVHHLLGPALPDDVVELANDALCPLWRSFGCAAPSDAGLYAGLTLDITPPSLPAERPRGRRLALQPTALPDRPPASVDPPLVYVTFGTFFGSLDQFRAVLDGLAGEPVRVVATVGSHQDPAALEPVPGNIRVERFIPQAELLPDCSLVVHHGGAGTMFGAFAHGVPQLVLPQGADNFTNAELVAASGAGTALAPEEVAADRVADAARALLADSATRDAAQSVAEDIADMPSPPEVADRVRSEVLDGVGP